MDARVETTILEKKNDFKDDVHGLFIGNIVSGFFIHICTKQQIRSAKMPFACACLRIDILMMFRYRH